MTDVQFDSQGLIPAIVQDARTREVLMIAYMNRESLARTLESGETVFWSRRRAEFWHKGETSGNTQHVVSIHADCTATRSSCSSIRAAPPATPAR